MLMLQALVTGGSFDVTVSDHRRLLQNMLMTASDIGAISRPWEVQRVVAEVRC